MLRGVSRVVAGLILLALLFIAWNKPGFGGQVAHSPNGDISAWLSHRGWAGWNGNYVVTLLDNATARVLQRYSWRCSTPHFAQMRETPERYLAWDETGLILTVSLPGENPLMIKTGE